MGFSGVGGFRDEGGNGFGGNCYNVGQVGHGKSECRHAKRVNGVDKGVQDEDDVVECGRIKVEGHIHVRANHNDDENEFPNVAKRQARGSLLGVQRRRWDAWAAGCLGTCHSPKNGKHEIAQLGTRGA